VRGDAALVAAVLSVLFLGVHLAPSLRAEDEARPVFIRGDANIDGRTTLADVFAILRYLSAGGRLDCKTAADVDDDGVIDQSDALYLLGALFYRHSPPLPPFVKAAPDPTPEDNLGCRHGLRSAGGGIAPESEDADPSPGDILKCHEDPHGVELDFVHFRGPVLAAPGDERVRTPIILESPFGLLEGLTLSIQAPPGIVLRNIDFRGTVVDEVDPQWIHVYKGQMANGFLTASMALSITPPFRTLPRLFGETVAYLEFSVGADVAVGSRLEIRFLSTPAEGDLPPIRTELSRQGRTQPHATCGLLVDIVSGDDLFIRGDATRDSLVNITDVVLILRGLFLSTGSSSLFPCPDAADVDDSGQVGLTDAVRLARYLFGLAPAPETPFPQAGRDSDKVDGIGCVASS
jgi:hypothetical protein